MPHGYGTKITPKSTHSGFWKNGVPNGAGVKQHLTKLKGMRCVGTWTDGFLDGNGSIYYANGLVYHGSLDNGRRQGFGRLFNENSFYQSSKNSLTYEGEWLENKKHGFGTSFGQDGSKYVGHWENHKRHGQGKFYYKNGCCFETEFNQGTTQLRNLKFFDSQGDKFTENWNDQGYQIIDNVVYWLDGSCFFWEVRQFRIENW